MIEKRTLFADPIDGSPLPSGWAWSILGEIAELVGGGTPSRQVPEYFGDDIVWLTPTEIPRNRVSIVYDSNERLSKLGLQKSSAKIVPDGSVLMTSRASIGYVAVAGVDLATNQGFASFICEPVVYNFFLAYWLLANGDEFKQQATGTTFKEISKAQLRINRIPLAPLNEQRRIVEAIEALFSRLDAGIAALKRVQKNLKRYKASVLKAACEGRLVPQDPDDEPASELLARILDERRARWEADELARYEAQGKRPPKGWRDRYPEPQPPDTSDLPDLPEGWVWAPLGILSDVVDPQPSHRTPPEVTDGIPYIGMRDITDNGSIDFEEARKVSPTVLDEHRTRYRLSKGDFIIGKIGTIGRPFKLPEPFEYALSANIVLIQPKLLYVDHTFLFFYMASPFMETLLAEGSRATSQAAFGILRVRQLPVPLPPYSEQVRIAQEIEVRHSALYEFQRVVNHNLKCAERLRQSILKDAFAGRLVPQDPDDEPASVLLARIRAERAARKE